MNRIALLACLVAASGLAQAQQASAQTTSTYTSGVAQGGGPFCESATGCGKYSRPSTVFDDFSLTAVTPGDSIKVTSFSYDAVFVAQSDYVSTTWSIWTGGSSAVYGNAPADLLYQGSDNGTISTDPQRKISKVEISSLDLALDAGETYWLAIQNVLASGKTYSIYVSSDGIASDGFITDQAQLYTSATSGVLGGPIGVEPMQMSSPEMFAISYEDGGFGGPSDGPQPPPVVSAPEPSTWALVLIGFAGAAAAAWPRRIRPFAT